MLLKTVTHNLNVCVRTCLQTLSSHVTKRYRTLGHFSVQFFCLGAHVLLTSCICISTQRSILLVVVWGGACVQTLSCIKTILNSRTLHQETNKVCDACLSLGCSCLTNVLDVHLNTITLILHRHVATRLQTLHSGTLCHTSEGSSGSMHGLPLHLLDHGGVSNTHSPKLYIMKTLGIVGPGAISCNVP